METRVIYFHHSKSFDNSCPPVLLPFLSPMKSVPQETDFIVVGAGVAGLRAAIELAQSGRVLVLTKQEITESATQYAQGQHLSREKLQRWSNAFRPLLEKHIETQGDTQN